MAKLNLTAPLTLNNVISSLGTNFDLIEAAVENTLSRDGTSPNHMSAPLNMNSERIYNLPDPVSNSDAATRGYVDLLAGQFDSANDDLQVVANGEVFNAFDYVPDSLQDDITAGTSTVDVYTYIQLAATAAAGSTLYIPKGLYNFSDNVAFPANTRIIGYGAVFKALASNTSNPVLLEVANHAGNVLIEGVTFDGNLTGLITTAFNNVVTVFAAQKVRFFRCKWQNCKGIALIFSTNCQYGEMTYSETDTCGTYDTISLNDADRKQAVALTGTGVDNFLFAYNHFKNSGLDSLALQGSTDSKVIGNRFDGTRAAFYVSTCTRPIIVGNHCTNALTPSDLLGGPGIDCANSSDILVADNTCYNNDSAGILLANIDGALVSNNICFNNQNASLGFTPNHLGGICISATSGEVCRDLVLTGNICYDNRSGANVKQLYAVHTFDQGGTFDNIQIDNTNRFEGYDVSGNKNIANVFFSGDLGYSGRDLKRSLPSTQRYDAVNNATAPSILGAAAVASDGTATGINKTSTSYYTRQSRIRSPSAASTGANGGTRFRDFTYRVDAQRLVIRFGWEDFATNAAAFIGLKSDAAHGNGDPSAFTNCIGVGIDAGQTTWRLLHNDSSGSATATDLGAQFPANTDATDWYELEMWWGDSATSVHWKLTRCNTGDTTRGNIETNLPSLTTTLNTHVVCNTRTGSAAIDLAYGTVVREFN